MRRLALLLAAFLLLGFAYSIATPIFETPDELQHYAHVNYIARYGWFPPLGDKPADHLWDQQSLQAPLFYWAAAAVTFWVDTSDFSQQAVLQPKANIGDATLPGKKNAFLHGPDQSFPYRGTTLAVHLCRWLSAILGAGTVALTFAIALMLFRTAEGADGTDKKVDLFNSLYPLSTLASASLAFIPQFLFINASCSNDPAITFTSTLTLFLLARAARKGVTPRRAALIGFAIGLMALSKLIGSALAIVAFGLLVILVVAQLRSDDLSRQATKVATPKRFIAPMTIAFAVFALTAGWWYARNQIVYGDPLALTAFLNFVGGNLDVPPMSLPFLWDQFRLLRFSTWGLFGHISVLMQPEWIYIVFDLAALAGLIGFAIWVGRGIMAASNKIAWVSENRVMLIVLIWLAAVLAIGARWFVAAGIQGRLIFPGLPAGAILWAGGISYVSKYVIHNMRYVIRDTKFLALGLIMPMATFALAVIPAYLIPAYSPPPLVSQVPADVTQAEIKFGDEIALRGYTFARDRDVLRLTFYWETLRSPEADYTLALRLVRPDGSFWLDYVNYPGMGTTLPTTWRPGELRRDEYVFDTDRFPAVTAPLRLIVGFFDPRVRNMILISNWSDIREKGWATLTQLSLNGQ